MRLVVKINEDGEYITVDDRGLCVAVGRLCGKAVVTAYRARKFLCKLCKLKKGLFPHGERK